MHILLYTKINHVIDDRHIIHVAIENQVTLNFGNETNTRI